MPWINASFPSISSSAEKEPIAVVGGLALLKSNLKSLRNEEWLSDAVLDIFLTFRSQATFLKARNIEELSFPWHFITWLLVGKCSSSGVRHWVALIKPLRYYVWLIPALVNDDHWLLNALISKKQILTQLNSFHNGNSEVIEAILDFFGSEYFDSFGQYSKIGTYVFPKTCQRMPMLTTAVCLFACAVIPFVMGSLVCTKRMHQR